MMSDVKASMQSLLECSICLEPFTDPRMLTCMHTLCHKCLTDHIEHSGENGEFKCPECRKLLPVPTDGANGFPKNFFVNRYMGVVVDTGAGARSKTGLTSYIGRQEPLESKCSNYEAGDDCTQPEQFCIECCEYYCEGCSKAHRKFKPFRGHELVALCDLTAKMLTDAKLKTEIQNCVKHKKKLKFYCNTCERPVCSICRYTSHEGHSFQEMKDEDTQLKCELNDAISTLSHINNKLKGQSEGIDGLQNTLDDQVFTAKAAIHSVLAQMSKMLIEKERELDQDINQIVEMCMAEAEIQKTNLTSQAQSVDNLLSFVHDLLKNGNVFSRREHLPDVRDRMEQLRGSLQDNSDDPDETAVPESIEFIADNITCLELEKTVPVGKIGEVKIIQKCIITPKKGRVKIGKLWQSSGLFDFLTASQNIQDLIKVNSMKFTDGQEEPVDKSISILRIQHELDYLLDMESSNETVFNWIVENVENVRTREASFIHTLMKSVCSSAISEAGDGYNVDSEVIKVRKPLLQRYVDHIAQHELRALIRMEYSSDVQRHLFDALSKWDIISEGAFNQYEDPVQFFNWEGDCEERFDYD